MKILILILLFIAAVEDMKKMEVGNIYPASVFIISLVNMFISPYTYTKLILLNALVVFAVLFAYWLVGAMGGADVKVLTALSLYTGFDIWKIILISCVFFVIYSIALRRYREKLPFMPAVFIGSMVVFLLKGW